jgi:hypothetical protein
MDPQNYIVYFNNSLLGLLFLVALIYSSGTSRLATQEGMNIAGSWAVSASVVLFLGTRPVSGAFVDMVTYAQKFEVLASGGEIKVAGDILFDKLMRLVATSGLSVEFFFIICAMLYVIPLASGSAIIHGRWGFPVLLALISSFSFFAYGVNGIRNGIAASLVILAIGLQRKLLVSVLLCLIAVGIHKSAAITITAFACAMVCSIPALYAFIWLFCLGLCTLYGETTGLVIAGMLPTSDDARVGEYFGGVGADKGGYRLDFILYSIVPVVISHFMGTRQSRQSLFYRRLICTYLLANAFWLLSMYAAFSNRFAYLSWCLLPWVVICPLLPEVGRDRPAKPPESTVLIGMALLAHFSFTYGMHMFYYR